MEARRTGGRRGASSQKILRSLDRFLMSELKPGQPLSREIVERWIESLSHLSPSTRINRISVLKQFCRYQSLFDPRTCIVCNVYMPCRVRPVPHIFSKGDMRSILATAKKLGPPGSFRPVVVATLIGVLYATGLRIGEALNLNLGDIDLKRRVIEVREGKFGKARYVPLSRSTVGHLAAYMRQRCQAGFETAPCAPVFPNVAGRRQGHPGFVTVFLQIIRGLGLRGPVGQPGPRVHDLRHTFAVHRLLAWYRHGDNLQAKLPLLSTYLGHSTLSGTEIYLHATAQLLESAGRRFHAHFAVPRIAITNGHDKD